MLRTSRGQPCPDAVAGRAPPAVASRAGASPGRTAAGSVTMDADLPFSGSSPSDHNSHKTGKTKRATSAAYGSTMCPVTTAE
eukprot:7238984-Alexandrium_andersonii.AAC.1